MVTNNLGQIIPDSVFLPDFTKTAVSLPQVSTRSVAKLQLNTRLWNRQEEYRTAKSFR